MALTAACHLHDRAFWLWYRLDDGMGESRAAHHSRVPSDRKERRMENPKDPDQESLCHRNNGDNSEEAWRSLSSINRENQRGSSPRLLRIARADRCLSVA